MKTGSWRWPLLFVIAALVSLPVITDAADAPKYKEE
jgi:hypothetical protein